MSKEREALKLALEGLEYIHEGANNQGPHTGISWRCVSNKAEPAITAIREALAEPAQQQKPVARVINKSIVWRPCDIAGLPVGTPLYTSPPASKPWVGLTDEERNKIWRDVIGWGDPSHDDEDLMKAIEAKLKERNTCQK